MADKKEQIPEKKVFFTEKINRMISEVKSLNREGRFRYQTDAKALMCRGIEDEEVKTLSRGLQIESGFFYLSRAFVPVSLFYLYK